MPRRSAFPALVTTYYLQRVHESFDPASERVLAALQHLFATEIGPRRSSFGPSAKAADGYWLLLAHTGDTSELIGYALCRAIDQYGSIHGQVSELMVLPEYRRQGVAQSLLSGAEALFIAHQDPRVSALAATVPARRHEALNAFIRAGFETLVQGDDYLFRLPVNRASAHR
jgi:ribosomal protein S18 acetylase RimI-like enzyme